MKHPSMLTPFVNASTHPGRSGGARRLAALVSAALIGAIPAPVSADQGAAARQPGEEVPACSTSGLALDAPCISVAGRRVAAPTMVPAERPVEASATEVSMAELSEGDGARLFQRLCEGFAGESIHKLVDPVDIVVDMRPFHRVDLLVAGPVQQALGWRNADPRRWLQQLMQRDPWLIEDPLAAWNQEDLLSLPAAIVGKAGFGAFEAPIPPPPTPPGRSRARGPALPGREVAPESLPAWLRLPPSRREQVSQDTWAYLDAGIGETFLAPAPRLGIRARYGFERRGLVIPGGRESGVVGREVRVIDLDTGEVVATQRAFMHFTPPDSTQSPSVCPADAEGAVALALFLARALRGQGQSEPKQVQPLQPASLDAAALQDPGRGECPRARG
jgi:hypothetical protein